MSPAARLCAFAILLVALFLGARAVGMQLGPVTTIYSRTGISHTGSGGSGSMNMGAGREPGTGLLLPGTWPGRGRR